jgi:hypothetical protein
MSLAALGAAAREAVAAIAGGAGTGAAPPKPPSDAASAALRALGSADSLRSSEGGRLEVCCCCTLSPRCVCFHVAVSPTARHLGPAALRMGSR